MSLSPRHQPSPARTTLPNAALRTHGRKVRISSFLFLITVLCVTVTSLLLTQLHGNDNGNNMRLMAEVPQEEPPPSHPHGGARDSKGKLGYVHDATYLKRHPLKFSHVDEVCKDAPGNGTEGSPEAYQALQKIVISPDDNKTRKKKKVFCMVYTHSNHHEFVQAIAETWGSRCDGFMAASNATVPTIGAVDLIHMGPEAYQNMWQKVRSMWAYAHDHYIDDYDYFHIGGDDMYVIPENLQSYVETLKDDDSKPIYMGGPIAGLLGRPAKVYCGGGSGYTLNRAALKLFVNELLPTCRHNTTGSGEDYGLALCFLEKGVKCQDTSDPAYRYHAQDVQFQVTWTFDKSPHNILQRALKARHGMDPQDGIDGVSTNSVSFHLKQIRAEESWKTVNRMRRYHAVLHGLCH